MIIDVLFVICILTGILLFQRRHRVGRFLSSLLSFVAFVGGAYLVATNPNGAPLNLGMGEGVGDVVNIVVSAILLGSLFGFIVKIICASVVSIFKSLGAGKLGFIFRYFGMVFRVIFGIVWGAVIFAILFALWTLAMNFGLADGLLSFGIDLNSFGAIIGLEDIIVNEAGFDLWAMIKDAAGSLIA